MLRCLKQQVEGAEIHYLVKKSFFPVIQHNPYVAKFHLLEDDLDALIRQLKAESFDYIIDLHNSLRSVWVRSRLRVLSFSVDKLNLARFLMINFKINRLPDLHMVDRYMHTLQAFDVRDDGGGLDYFIPDRDEIHSETLPAAFRRGYIAFVIGTQHATKQLPQEKMIEICRELRHPVILVGGPKEEVLGEAVAGASGRQVWNACGRFNLNQSASIVRQSRMVITHDTGLMHIAAAFRKIIFSVWGHTIPAFGMYPYRPDPASRIFEVGGLPCRPCTRTGRARCPKGHFRCMREQDPPGIAAAANAIFEAS